jgi:hypothetical protein
MQGYAGLIMEIKNKNGHGQITIDGQQPFYRAFMHLRIEVAAFERQQ